MGEESEDEFTSKFFVVDFQITAKDVGSCEDGDTYFVSYPKQYYKWYLQSPLEPHNEQEDKDTTFGCEAKNFVEEHATLVSLHKDDEYGIPMYDGIYGLWKYHIALQSLEIPFTSYHGTDFV